MNTNLFRKSSMERVTSPEQLNDYIRVSNPGVWMVLAAVILLLTGVCVWGIFGRLDTTVACVCVSDGNSSVVYIKEADIISAKTAADAPKNGKDIGAEAAVADRNPTDVGQAGREMRVTVGGQEYRIAAIGAEPVSVDESFSEYALHAGELRTGEWVYEVTLEHTLPEGVYGAEVIVESVRPVSFVIN